ncbi:MAG: ABC transporter ATP-binding protein [Defluviitaleaceae bacterium]|nr:ABC transporter ATP-binding protein [Defluviitaleaceae bacterium]MCL2239542.1 ABC transporter ATP-binding protein [Defluviitaleaceae bacterium]
MDNILEITDLGKRYGRMVAVEGVRFSLAPGKILGLLGPNGSGKTTIMKVIMGLLTDYTGEVRIAGAPPEVHPPGVAANRYISYLPDAGHIPTWFTTEQAIRFFADFYTDFDEAKAGEMLDAMKIPRHKRVKALSRGMQEKVQLAMVMARRAKLYILDEPIGAVDPASRDFILNTLLAHYAEDSAILLSSHIIADIESVLDEAVFLREGKICMMGEADALRQERGMSLDQIFREVFRNA